MQTEPPAAQVPDAAPAAAVTGATVARLARGVRLRADPVRGQTILLAPERAIALDEIAVRIAEALDGRRTLAEIAADFALAFGAPEAEVAADVIGFVTELSNRRMLEILR